MAVVDDINRIFREFRRYTGDGLPGAPVNAPLPVGDPQSGPHSPKKADIRLVFGGLLTEAEDATEAAEAARDAAIEAQLAAESAAGANLSNLASRTAAILTHIPASVGYIRTAGYALPGDGGGALYKPISAPDTPKAWQFQSADGAWWELAEKLPTPQMFGARGDGGTDDSDPIQNALDFSKVVHFPSTANGYRVTKTIDIKQSGAVLFGDAGSNRASYINVANHTFDVFSASATGNVEIRDLAVMNYGSKTAGKYAFRFDHTYGVHMKGIQIYGCTSGILLGADGSSTGGASSRIQSVDIAQLGAVQGVGIYIGGLTEIREILDCVINGPAPGANASTNAGYGIRVRGGAAVVLINLELVGCGNPIYVDPPAGASVAHMTMHNVWCDSSSGNGLVLDGTAGAIVEMRASQSWFSACTVGIYIAGIVRSAKFSGNTVINNRSDGVSIAAGASVGGLIIEGSEVGGSAGSGIAVGSGASDILLRGNQIGAASAFGANLYGVYLVGSNNNYIIDGNNLRGNTNAGLVGHAATATKIAANNIGA
jgi:hypothetical protein